MPTPTASTADAAAADTDGDAAATIKNSDGSITIATSGHSKGHDGTSITTVADEDAIPLIDHRGIHGSHTFLWIIALFVVAGLVRTWIRARHGDTRTWRERKADIRAGRTAPNLATTRDNEALAEENARLKALATKLEERVTVLERIVTDPAKRVSDEIDALR